MDCQEKLLVITGPTASGKSARALQEAAARNGEIVSIDSMQLYRDLPIGTAQPTEVEKRAIPHHLVAIFDLHQRCDVTTFCAMADEAIKDIRSRGKLPILCGGTGFYLRALICGMDELPADRELRAQLDAEFDRDDAEADLHRKAAEIDPEALEKFRNCRRKLIRALEVKILCGKSIMQLQQGFAAKRRYEAEVWLIAPEREILKEKIRLRVDKMLAAGWIEETEAAIGKGLFSSPTAHQALGYRIIGDYLAGRITRNQLPELLATATWQYARRQLTWFRHQPPGYTRHISTL